MTNTNGIVNNGNIATTTLSTTAGATVGSNLNVGGTLTVGSGFSVGGATNTISNGSRSLVVDGESVRLVNGANKVVVGASGIDLAGNGAQIILSGANASLVNNTNHGVVVTSNQTVITGGTTSTRLVLDDAGATFSNTLTGGAAKVTGIADGTTNSDAVNFNQLQTLDKRMSAGIAATTAIANMPALESDKTFAVGVGIGHFNGASAMAIGGNYRMSPNAVFKASVGSNGRRNNTTYGAGASFSW